MLVGQNLRRRHDTRLVPIVQRQQRRQQRDHGFTAAHIALQQPIHVPPGVQVGADLAHHSFLRSREFKRDVLAVISVE